MQVGFLVSLFRRRETRAGGAGAFGSRRMGNLLGMVDDNTSPTDDDVRLLFVTRRTSGIGRRMESVLATLQARKRDGISIHRVDADAEPELVGQLGVDQIPTLVFVKNRRSVAQICGRATLDEIENVIAAVSAV